MQKVINKKRLKEHFTILLNNAKNNFSSFMKKEELKKCTSGSRLVCLHKITVSAVGTAIVAICNVLLLTSMLHVIKVPSITQQCYMHC